MKSITSWLLVFFTVIFWVFRIVVTLSAQYGGDFGGFVVFDSTLEIAMLFVTVLCFILVVKRLILGGIIYLGGYGFYFGKYLINEALPNFTSGEEIDFLITQNAIIAVIGILLGAFLILDIFVERVRSKHFSDDKTDWYFNNKEYDRKIDERADKNQYRTL